jgi:putative heme-binding domain-containing protein
LLAAPLPESTEPLAVQLRTWSILFARGLEPSKLVARHLTERLAPLYPHPSVPINRDLCELLVFLEWPDIVAKTLPLIESADSQEDEVFHVHALLRYAGSWTPEQRTTILRWFQHAATFTGGHLLPQVMANMRQDFLESFTEAERTALATVIDEVQAPPSSEQQPAARPLVQRWTLADLLPQLSEDAGAHDPQAGRKVLVEAGCLKCHRWEQSGAAIGPDLTSVGKRYSLQMIAESIIDPSKVVDPKYSSTQWLLKSGQVVIGRAAGVQAREITVETNGLTQETVVINRDEIEESKPSTVSPMPTGLLDSFTPEEVRQLLHFLRGPVLSGEIGGGK